MQRETFSGLPAPQRDQVVNVLNACLANTIDLHWQTKTAHWNVQGPAFHALHLLFDEIAKRLRKHADRLAERAAALGGVAEGTIRVAARRSVIAEYDLDARDGLEHVRLLAQRLGVHAISLRGALSRLGRDGAAIDPVTDNLLIEIIAEVEQDLWFLESHLRGGAEERRESALAEQRPDL